MPNILIIDDDPVIHDVAKAFLEADGRHFSHATTLAEGKVLLDQERQFDVLMLDNGLPDGIGSTSIQHLKEHQPSMQVILMTACPTMESAVEAVKGGAVDYIEKPFDPAVIEQKVQLATQRAVAERQREGIPAQLMESQERYRQIFAAASDAFILFEQASGEIREVNPAAERMYGRTSAQFAALTFDELVEEGSMFATQLGERVRQVHRRGAFETFPAEVTFSEIQLGSEYVALATVRDISHMERMEQEQQRLQSHLQEAQKMEAMGRLAGGVAHDFNNLLFVVLNSADFLADSGTVVAAQGKQALEDIVSSALQGTALTRRLLAFTRRGDGDAAAVVDLNAAVREAQSLLLRVVGADVNLSMRYGEGVGQVMADPDQLTQVLINLTVNARDALREGGRISITTRHRTVSDAEDQPASKVNPGEYHCIEVSDNGSGIPPRVVGRIFDPFFTTKKTGQGTGLGLSTVYGIVARFGGEIRVDSEVGAGTTFTIYLPARTEPSAGSIGIVDAGNTSGGPFTILLAEDDDSIRRMLKRMLEGRGFRVLAARDGADALAMSDEWTEPIHLVITDVVMPRVSGRDLVLRLLKDRPELQVLFISGYTDNVILRDGLMGEKINFLAKPFRQRQLFAAIAPLLKAAVARKE